MGIRVQYAPSAALVGKAALTAGQGDFGRFAAQMGQANADRAQRERMQHAGFSFQADRDRFQAAQQAMRTQEAQAFEMDRLATQQDFSILQQQAQVDAQRERDSMLAELDLNTRTQVQEQEFRLNQLGSNVKLAQDKDRIEYEFTQQEKAHNAKVQRAEQWVDEQVAKYSLSPDEALAMKAQLQGIKKPPTAKPFDAQEVMGKHLVDIPGYPGMKMWINPDGTKDDVRPPQAMISGGEFAAVIKSLSTTDLNGNTILPSEEVVRKYFGLYNKAAGNDTGFGLPGRAFAAGVGGEAGVDALAAPVQQGPIPGDPTAAKHMLGLLGAGGPQAGAPQASGALNMLMPAGSEPWKQEVQGSMAPAKSPNSMDEFFSSTPVEQQLKGRGTVQNPIQVQTPEQVLTAVPPGGYFRDPQGVLRQRPRN